MYSNEVGHPSNPLSARATPARGAVGGHSGSATFNYGRDLSNESLVAVSPATFELRALSFGAVADYERLGGQPVSVGILLVHADDELLEITRPDLWNVSALVVKGVRDAFTAMGGQVEVVDYTPLGPTYPRTSTGRRTALAKFITDRRNPLTARVAVNHLWMRHMNAPLVPRRCLITYLRAP